MLGETIAGIFLVEFVHDPVPGNLRQDTGGRNAQTYAVSTDERRVLDWKSFHRKAINKNMGAMMTVLKQSGYRAGHGKMSSPQDIQLPDFFRTALGHEEFHGGIPRQPDKKNLPLLVVQFLGIIQSLQ